MPEINLGLVASLLEKIRYNTGVARGSLTPQGTKAPDPVLGWFSRNNYKNATTAFNGGGWTTSSLNPVGAGPAYPESNFQQPSYTTEINFQQPSYTTTTNGLTEQEKVIVQNLGTDIQRASKVMDTFKPGRYRDEPNVGRRRRGSTGGAFGLVVWNDGSAVTEQVSSKFWKVALSDVSESDILEELAVIYFTTTDSCFTYTGQLLPAFEAVQNSGFLNRGGTVVVNSEWGSEVGSGFGSCGGRSTVLADDVNNTFGTTMVDLSTAVAGGDARGVTHPPLVSPFKSHKTNLTTLFTGGIPIYTYEGQAVVAYQNVSQGKVVRLGDSNMNGGHPELFDGDLDPIWGDILVSSFGTSLLAWTLGVSYEDIGDIRVD